MTFSSSSSSNSDLPETPTIVAPSSEKTSGNFRRKTKFQHQHGSIGIDASVTVSFDTEQIVRLHEEGHWVRWNDVIWRLLSHFRIDYLIRMQNKIDVYLDACVCWQTLGTLHELEVDLARLFSKNDYQDLRIGSIEKC